MDADLFEQRIKKLINSKPVLATGLEYEGLYELNNRSAERYILNRIRGNYYNIDTEVFIRTLIPQHFSLTIFISS